jgi:hypothetical protein
MEQRGATLDNCRRPSTHTSLRQHFSAELSANLAEGPKAILAQQICRATGGYAGDHAGDHEGNHAGDHTGDHAGDHTGDHLGDHAGDHAGDHKATCAEFSGGHPRLK